jgi:DnaJ domain
MASGGRQYWIKTEQGRVWGPYEIDALERLRGQLTDRAEASLDGHEFRPGLDFPELRSLLTAPRAQPRAPSAAQPRPTPAAGMYVGKAIRAMLEQNAAKAQVAPAAPAPPPSAPSPPVVARPSSPPVMRPAAVVQSEKLELPPRGNVSDVSPVRLYALAALAGASGTLEIVLESGRKIAISFRRGTPDHVSSDDPELSFLRFLQVRKTVSAEQAAQAEGYAGKNGVDVVSALFQLQLIPAADAHKLLGEHALFLLDRAIETSRGTFSFNADAPSPSGAFALGQKWTLLTEAVRRMDQVALSPRLSKQLARPVLRSGGSSIGNLEELALTAQEARLFASVDGMRRGEELVQQHAAAMPLRILYLLSELKHVSFSEVEEARAASAPPPPAAATGSAPANGAAKRPTPAVVAPVPPAAASAPRPTPAAVVPVAAAAAARPTPAAVAPMALNGSSPPRQTPLRGTPPVGGSSRQTPAPAKPAGPVRTFATPPPNETPEAQLARLRGLLERLEKGTHFDALGLDRKTAAAEVKKAFVLLARELHPDTVTDPAQTELHDVKERLFARVNEAAQVLGDDARRKEYEAELGGDKKDVDVGRIFDAEEKFQRAEILIKARKYKEGLALLDEAIQLNDKEAEFHAWRGYARFLLAGDRKQAFDDCSGEVKKALKMVERCLPAHLFLGHMNKVIGNLKAAASSYQRVIDLDPAHIEAQRELRLMGKKA